MKNGAVLLLFSFFFEGACWARGAEAVDPLRAMVRARTRAALIRTASLDRELRRQRRVCEVQLRDGRVPAACFFVIETEAEELSDAGRERSWLAGLCVDRVRKSIDRREIALAASLKLLPDRCRRVALERDADLRYADRNVRPERLFQGRFKP